MLSSLKLYTFIALFAFTFARKHCKNPNTPKTPKINYPIGPTTPDCPTACTDCAENQQCKLIDNGPGSCPTAKCVPFKGSVPCTKELVQCLSNSCENGMKCQVLRSPLHCDRIDCFSEDEECLCSEPKNTCDTCDPGQVCFVDKSGPCPECKTPKCVTPPDNVLWI
jgi:hypothetical protein